MIIYDFFTICFLAALGINVYLCRRTLVLPHNDQRMKYDYLLVGAGLFNAVFAREATRRGKKCLVVDRRPALGGNVRCESVGGINVHCYGAHIFHTSDERVWRYVTALVPFNRFTNSPLASYGGRLYSLPFNMHTFYEMWQTATPAEALAKLEEQRREAREAMSREGIAEPRNLEEQALALVGRDIYERLIRGYTEKQWGRACRDLPAFIIRRLPVRLTYDCNYFNDTYQGIPIGGYNPLIERLFEGCDCRLSCDYLRHRAELDAMAEHVVFTGAIDEYFDYSLGRLAYRSLRFETETLDVANYQGNAVVNYTDSRVPYTRVIEHKHFEMFGDAVAQCPQTVVSREYSLEWQAGAEPYYPVNDEANSRLYAEYRRMAEALAPRVVFGGRLGEYKYYDMDDTVAEALRCSSSIK